jgi:DNA-binding LacI/PurR family transcriptional regulator
VDGFLLFISPGDEQEVQALVKAKRPVVFVGRTPLSLSADSVSADNTKGTRMAVQHLVAKGHRRIGLINGQQGLSSSSERLNGWKRTLQKAGLSAPRELVAHGDWTADAGFAATQEFLRLEERPTAIFTANLLMMTGALRALKERKIKCPQDIEVMSSDDSDWLDVFEPRISTVAQPSYEMGSQAAHLLLKRIKAPNRRVEQVALEPELMIRD